MVKLDTRDLVPKQVRPHALQSEPTPRRCRSARDRPTSALVPPQEPDLAEAGPKVNVPGPARGAEE